MHINWHNDGNAWIAGQGRDQLQRQRVIRLLKCMLVEFAFELVVARVRARARVNTSVARHLGVQSPLTLWPQETGP